MSGLAEDLATRFEKQGHSFVIRLWKELGDPARPDGVWRGSITHVESNKRYYVRSTTEIERIVASYMNNQDSVISNR